MHKHVLVTPLDTPHARLTAVALRLPTPADKAAILAEVERTKAASDFARSAIMIARLADLPLDVVRKLAVRDARALTVAATRLFCDAGMP